MVKNIIRFIIYPFLYSIDFIVITLGKTFKKNIVFSQDILLVRVDAIGDFIVWLDQARHYREIHPNAQITLVANDIWSELAKQMPHWDHVIPLNRKKFKHNIFYRINFLLKVQKQTFNCAIATTLSREHLYDDAIIHAVRAEKKIGSQGDFENAPFRFFKHLSDKFYTNLFNHVPEKAHELVRNISFVNAFADKNFKINRPEISFDSPRPNGLPKQYAVICPAASAPFKQWPIDNFLTILQHLQSVYNISIVITGGLSDQHLGNYLALHLDSTKVFNFIGKTSLTDLCFIIKNAKMVLSNDTCATHIAFAVNTPSICILGGGHYGRFFPYPDGIGEEFCRPRCVVNKMSCFNCGWKNPCSPKKGKSKSVMCIQQISIKDVLKEVTNILGVNV